jgi:hypothetical protein
MLFEAMCSSAGPTKVTKFWWDEGVCCDTREHVFIERVM